MTLTPIPVRSAFEIQVMRRIRNRTASGYAYHNDWISPDQQAVWWADMGERVRAWLYQDGDGATVGFGMLLRHDDGTDWTTVGVLPEHGGHNYGRQITAHLIRQVPGRVYGCARKDNPAAVFLHVPEDWMMIDGPDPRLVYFQTLKGAEVPA